MNRIVRLEWTESNKLDFWMVHFRSRCTSAESIYVGGSVNESFLSHPGTGIFDRGSDDIFVVFKLYFVHEKKKEE